MGDNTELKRLAEIMVRDVNGDLSDAEARNFHQHLSDYEAATTPEKILALIAENKRLKSVSNFQEAVACVFDFAKIAAANTGCRDWDEQLEEFAGDVIEFAPEYKRQWLDIVKLAADNERLKADCSSMRGSLKANAASIKKLIKDGSRAARERDQLKAENEALIEKYEAARDRKNSITALKIENEQLKADLVVFKGGISALGEASKKLTFCARTTGGTAGPDQGLMDACNEVEKSLSFVGVSRAIDYIEGLRAEVAVLKTGCEAYERVNAELKAEVGALRKLGPSKEIIWCACGDGYPVNSYGAGFMDANNGVCANCDAALGQGEQP